MATKKKATKKRAEFKIASPKVEEKSSRTSSSTDNGFLKMVSIIFGILLFLVACAYIYKWTTGDTKSSQKVRVEKENTQIPKGWTKVEGTSDQVKYEKKIEDGIKPTVVLIQSESTITSPAEYTDKLIAGTRSAIPSLVLEDDNTSTEGSYFKRMISGYYYSGNDQIYIKQTLLINGNRVKTITASYNAPSEELDKEIDQLFKYLITTL